MLNTSHTPHFIRFLALALAAVAALLVPSVASAASSGGAVVFSRVVTKTVTETVKDAEGKPVKDAEGKEETKVKTTVEGGLVAVKDGHQNQLTEDPTDTEPSFSPDSRAIVFSRAGDVFSVRADGSGLRRVTSGPESIRLRASRRTAGTSSSSAARTRAPRPTSTRSASTAARPRR